MNLGRCQLLQFYYLATPLFFLVDLLWEAPIRVAFVEDVSIRYSYYLLCLLCGGLCYRRPRMAPLVGLFESSLNILLLVLSALLPLYRLPEQILTEEVVTNPITSTRITNFCLSGLILVISFRSREIALGAMRGQK
jgi:hypothetical protein